MKVTRALLGKYVEVRWRDPMTLSRIDVKEAPKGNAALAYWVERGVIDDLTDGVVRVIHSEGRNPGVTTTDEICYVVVPEELIESVTVFEPVREGQA